MITATGYSKDPSIIPEGIVVTFGQEMIREKGGLRPFIRWFEGTMEQEGGYWMHKCKNRPQYDDLLYVYVIICNRLRYRCLYGGYMGSDSGTIGVVNPAGVVTRIDWPAIIMRGPAEKIPFKRTLKGFQGFRYSTKLF